MNFLKKYRYTIIIVLIFLLLVCLGVKLKDILMPNNSKESYGNRLDNIDEHKIEDSLYTKIETEMKAKGKVTRLTHRIQGKTIIFIATVTKDVEVKDAKTFGSDIVAYFSDDDIEYYTLQIYVNKEDESLNNFPIIGVKSPASKELIWSKDREITKSEDTNEE